MPLLLLLTPFVAPCMHLSVRCSGRGGMQAQQAGRRRPGQVARQAPRARRPQAVTSRRAPRRLLRLLRVLLVAVTVTARARRQSMTPTASGAYQRRQRVLSRQRACMLGRACWLYGRLSGAWLWCAAALRTRLQQAFRGPCSVSGIVREAMPPLHLTDVSSQGKGWAVSRAMVLTRQTVAVAVGHVRAVQSRQLL